RRQPALAFRSLHPLRAPREPDRRRRDEEPPSRSEQRTLGKPKTLLDRKRPIQVRIRFPPPASLSQRLQALLWWLILRGLLGLAGERRMGEMRTAAGGRSKESSQAG